MAGVAVWPEETGVASWPEAVLLQLSFRARCRELQWALQEVSFPPSAWEGLVSVAKLYCRVATQSLHCRQVAVAVEAAELSFEPSLVSVHYVFPRIVWEVGFEAFPL